ncbi:MAG: family 10 glycosylhydrolase [Bacteroidetes bacterium]|nr:family 10 glycosylhydrolase [Bacteroidota bacterium]
MMRSLSLTAYILLIAFCLHAQTPKREFRAAWIATVANIDWPSKQGLPSEQQQQEFIRRLNELQHIGCNAVIVQVRPASDLMYPGDEPWSHYLTGRQGQPPFPYYDPLKFMIEETHKRNMEFHAWFNPYRALTESAKNPNPKNHVTYKHPNWIINYAGKAYINPGIPEARDYVIDIIMDVVKRYDIDGVHLDDYFYPYRSGRLEFGDYAAFSQYGHGFASKDDWRRDNTNRFISQLNAAIKREKNYVKFGVSPFGVWRNDTKDPDGSHTHGGQTCYDDLYADVVLWLKKGWVDYIMPQLYWEHYHRAAAFDVLLPWWENHSYSRHIYYGLGVYRMVGAGHGPWASSNELLWQIRDIRRTAKNPSQVFYSASIFDKVYGIKDSVAKQNIYYAFPPRMTWLDSLAPAPPIVKAIPSSQGTLLQWQMPQGQQKTVVRYAVYRFINNEPVNLDRSDKIIRVVMNNEVLDADANKYRKCTYIVTAFDRLWNESKASIPAETSTDR